MERFTPNEAALFGKEENTRSGWSLKSVLPSRPIWKHHHQLEGADDLRGISSAIIFSSMNDKFFQRNLLIGFKVEGITFPKKN